MESEATTTYKNSLTKLPHGMQVVEECYDAVQKTITELDSYLSVSCTTLSRISSTVSSVVIGRVSDS